MSNIPSNKTAVNSPCVRNCCLNENDICLGCYRHIDEIVAWQSLGASAKSEVLNKCQQRKTLLVRQKV